MGIMKSENISDFFAEKKERVEIKSISKTAEKAKEEYAPEKKKRGFLAKFADALVKFSVFMVFLGLPLFFTGRAFQGIDFEKQIYFYFWVLLGLVAWASKGVLEESMKIRRTPLDIPILIFWLVYLASTIFSIDRWHSLWGFFGDPSRGFFSVTAIIIFYYLYLSNFSGALFRWSVGALFSSGLLVSVYSALMLMNINFLPEQIKKFAPLGLLGSLENLGAFFAIMIPITIAIIFKVLLSAKANPFLKFIAVVTGIAGLVLNLSLVAALHNYMSWWGLFFGMIVFLVFMLSKMVETPANWTWIPMLTFVLIMVIILSIRFDIAKIELPTKVPAFYKISWDIAKNSVKDKFILGSGPATYGYDFSRFRPDNYNETAFSGIRLYQAAGFFFEALPAIGILGTLALIVVLLSYIGSAGHYLLKDREKNKLYSLGLMSSVVVFAVNFSLIRMEGGLILIGSALAILAMAAVLYESAAEENYLKLTLKASAKYALTMAFVFMAISAGVIYLFVFIGKAYVADIYAGSSSLSTSASGQVTVESVAKIKKAIDLYGREGRYYSGLGLEYMALANNEIIKGGKTASSDIMADYLNKAIENVSKGKNLMPNDAVAVESLAFVWENVGLYAKGENAALKQQEDNYKIASELEPGNPNYYLKLGEVKLRYAVALGSAAKGESNQEKEKLIQEAKDLFKKSIGKKKNFAPAYFDLALAEEALGGLDEAIRNMTVAFGLDRSNINYAFNLGRLYQARGKENDNANAENLFKQILGVNDKEINSHFNLGLLYERTNRKSEALAEYRKVLDLIPENLSDTRKQVEKMISNIENGAENTPENTANSENFEDATE
ncbi:hypothetical protein A3B56_02055 [Candidatus Roizmanbacteria bacterium RIFCSPLOWO2_01_FULL_45_11]|uniref:Uncharacterized protein n=1 Tax=Candidatus Roizmanbacteria bacterium RIFCSPLOWO2_01_FULL_45_11 TaxID=1802070 RepID=A0A1F7JIW6_9BACT|nr:MAG: hypothetical protein A3B56_02055 [Candidatus Roizmanbacteria bacterium RIFCSPLOWO2_01_FULL_45_11]